MGLFFRSTVPRRACHVRFTVNRIMQSRFFNFLILSRINGESTLILETSAHALAWTAAAWWLLISSRHFYHNTESTPKTRVRTNHASFQISKEELMHVQTIQFQFRNTLRSIFKRYSVFISPNLSYFPIFFNIGLISLKMCFIFLL